MLLRRGLMRLVASQFARAFCAWARRRREHADAARGGGGCGAARGFGRGRRAAEREHSVYIEAPALHWRGRCLALAWKTWHVNVVASPEVAAYWAAREKREYEAAHYYGPRLEGELREWRELMRRYGLQYVAEVAAGARVHRPTYEAAARARAEAETPAPAGSTSLGVTGSAETPQPNVAAATPRPVLPASAPALPENGKIRITWSDGFELETVATGLETVYVSPRSTPLRARSTVRLGAIPESR